MVAIRGVYSGFQLGVDRHSDSLTVESDSGHYESSIMFTMAREEGSGESKIIFVWAISYHDRFHSHKTPFHPKTRLSQRGGQALYTFAPEAVFHHRDDSSGLCPLQVPPPKTRARPSGTRGA